MIGFGTTAIVFQYRKPFPLFEGTHTFAHDIIPAIEKIINTMTDPVENGHEIIINMIFHIDKMRPTVMVSCITEDISFFIRNDDIPVFFVLAVQFACAFCGFRMFYVEVF